MGILGKILQCIQFVPTAVHSVEVLFGHKSGQDKKDAALTLVGEAVGIVTDRDICIALGTRNATAAMLTARDVMSEPVASCVPEDDCFVALMTMKQSGVHRLPVLGIGEVVLGIVSVDDIVRHAARAPATDPLRIGVMDVLAAVGGHKEKPQLARVAG